MNIPLSPTQQPITYQPTEEVPSQKIKGWEAIKSALENSEITTPETLFRADSNAIPLNTNFSTTQDELLSLDDDPLSPETDPLNASIPEIELSEFSSNNRLDSSQPPGFHPLLIDSNLLKKSTTSSSLSTPRDKDNLSDLDNLDDPTDTNRSIFSTDLTAVTASYQEEENLNSNSLNSFETKTSKPFDQSAIKPSKDPQKTSYLNPTSALLAITGTVVTLAALYFGKTSLVNHLKKPTEPELGSNNTSIFNSSTSFKIAAGAIVLAEAAYASTQAYQCFYPGIQTPSVIENTDFSLDITDVAAQTIEKPPSFFQRYFSGIQNAGNFIARCFYYIFSFFNIL